MGPSECFNENSTAYCIGTYLIATIATVNVVLLLLLLIWHLMAKPLISDIKTYTLTGMVSASGLVVYDILFGLDTEQALKMAVLVEFNLVSLLFMLICLDYVLRAAHLLDDSANLIKRMKVITSFGCAVVLAALAYEMVFETTSEVSSSLCETLYFVLTSAFNLAVNVVYLL
mgnify:CR=1 FL=1